VERRGEGRREEEEKKKKQLIDSTWSKHKSFGTAVAAFNAVNNIVKLFPLDKQKKRRGMCKGRGYREE